MVIGLYYNSVAESFHTSRLYSIEIEFYLKRKQKIVQPGFGLLTGKYILH